MRMEEEPGWRQRELDLLGLGGLAALAARHAGHGPADRSAGQDDGDDRPPPPFGMTSGQLATELALMVVDAQERILGVGAEQYDDQTHQRFEVMDLSALVEYAHEEALDLLAYAAMLSIRLRRLKRTLIERGVL